VLSLFDHVFLVYITARYIKIAILMIYLVSVILRLFTQYTTIRKLDVIRVIILLAFLPIYYTSESTTKLFRNPVVSREKLIP